MSTFQVLVHLPEVLKTFFVKCYKYSTPLSFPLFSAAPPFFNHEIIQDILGEPSISQPFSSDPFGSIYEDDEEEDLSSSDWETVAVFVRPTSLLLGSRVCPLPGHVKDCDLLVMSRGDCLVMCMEKETLIVGFVHVNGTWEARVVSRLGHVLEPVCVTCKHPFIAIGSRANGVRVFEVLSGAAQELGTVQVGRGQLVGLGFWGNRKEIVCEIEQLKESSKGHFSTFRSLVSLPFPDKDYTKYISLCPLRISEILLKNESPENSDSNDGKIIPLASIPAALFVAPSGVRLVHIDELHSGSRFGAEKYDNSKGLSLQCFSVTAGVCGLPEVYLFCDDGVYSVDLFSRRKSASSSIHSGPTGLKRTPLDSERSLTSHSLDFDVSVSKVAEKCDFFYYFYPEVSRKNGKMDKTELKSIAILPKASSRLEIACSCSFGTFVGSFEVPLSDSSPSQISPISTPFTLKAWTPVLSTAVLPSCPPTRPSPALWLGGQGVLTKMRFGALLTRTPWNSLFSDYEKVLCASHHFLAVVGDGLTQLFLVDDLNQSILPFLQAPTLALGYLESKNILVQATERAVYSGHAGGQILWQYSFPEDKALYLAEFDESGLKMIGVTRAIDKDCFELFSVSMDRDSPDIVQLDSLPSCMAIYQDCVAIGFESAPRVDIYSFEPSIRLIHSFEVPSFPPTAMVYSIVILPSTTRNDYRLFVCDETNFVTLLRLETGFSAPKLLGYRQFGGPPMKFILKEAIYGYTTKIFRLDEHLYPTLLPLETHCRDPLVYSVSGCGGKGLCVLSEKGISFISNISPVSSPNPLIFRTQVDASWILPMAHLRAIFVLDRRSYGMLFDASSGRVFSSPSGPLFSSEKPRCIAEWPITVSDSQYRNVVVGCAKRDKGAVVVLSVRRSEISKIHNWSTPYAVEAVCAIPGQNIVFYGAGSELWFRRYNSVKKTLDSAQMVYKCSCTISGIFVLGPRSLAVLTAEAGVLFFSLYGGGAAKLERQYSYNDTRVISSGSVGRTVVNILEKWVSGVDFSGNRFEFAQKGLGWVLKGDFLPEWSRDYGKKFEEDAFLCAPNGEILVGTLTDIEEYEEEVDYEKERELDIEF